MIILLARVKPESTQYISVWCIVLPAFPLLELTLRIDTYRLLFANQYVWPYLPSSTYEHLNAFTCLLKHACIEKLSIKVSRKGKCTIQIHINMNLKYSFPFSRHFHGMFWCTILFLNGKSFAFDFPVSMHFRMYNILKTVVLRGFCPNMVKQFWHY